MQPLDRLIEILCGERGESVPSLSGNQKPDFFRALCNVRPPIRVSGEFIKLQDEYLAAKTLERGVVDVNTLVYKDGVTVWQGDITRLKCGAIVNACNEKLLGCFIPLHNCIDNAIHSCAGVQLRLDCADIMKGKDEPNGRVRVTKGYNLPCDYVFHTVGAKVYGKVTAQNRKDLASCYNSCLDMAQRMGLESIAFCCISTGVYGYPPKEACDVAVGTVEKWREEHGKDIKIIFNVFKDTDRVLYERRLGFKN